MKNTIFVSLPYSAEEDSLREWRYKQCEKYALELIKQGHVVVAPILSGHHLAKIAKKNKQDIPTNYWYYVIDAHMKDFMEMHVLMLPGWKESDGIKYELLMAEEHRMFIKYIESTWYYTTPEFLDRLKTKNALELSHYIEYVLWDSSTEFIAEYGLPTNEQVELWIATLKSRQDYRSKDVRFAIKDCELYIFGVAE